MKKVIAIIKDEENFDYETFRVFFEDAMTGNIERVSTPQFAIEVSNLKQKPEGYRWYHFDV